MWGGIHFFVSIDALVTFRNVESAVPEGKPGCPRVAALDADGVEMRVMSFPNASLFLQTVRATGNQIHIITHWKRSVAQSVLSLFGLTDYVTDVRVVMCTPGSGEVLTLKSVSCDPTWYSNSVLVLSGVGYGTPSRWHPLLAQQIVSVQHEEPSFDSMALLYALCRCITLAEWRVRYPGTPVASCTALSACSLFQFCRFFMDPADAAAYEGFATLALLIAAHGGAFVTEVSTATHIISAPPKAARVGPGLYGSDDDGEEDSDDTSSESGSDGSSNSSSTSYSDADSKGNEAAPDNVRKDDMPPGSSPSSEDSSDSDTKKCVRGRAPGDGAATPDQSLPPPSRLPPPPVPIAGPTTLTAALATKVGVGWVQLSCQALRLLPTPPTGSPADAIGDSTAALAECLRTSGALLCAMLPPADAKPLLFSQFLQIARSHGFSPETFLVAESESATAVRLRTLLGGTLKISLMSSSVGTAGVVRGSTIALFRNERKRDRDAVSAHMMLTAAQFSYSLEQVTRARRLRTHRDAGTQMCRPRLAHARVGTEELEAVTAEASLQGGDVGVGTVSLSVQTPPVAISVGKTAAVPSASESVAAAPSVEDAEWAEHLKNVEGKLLRSCSEERSPTVAPSLLPPPLPISTPLELLPIAIFPAPPSEGGSWLPRPPSPVAAASSPPPPPPPLSSSSASSLFPRPSSPPRPLPIAGPIVVASSSSSSGTSGGDYTKCFLPAYQISAGDLNSLVAFLQRLPLLGPDSGATVRVEGMGVTCSFATAADAAAFVRVQFIEYAGTQLFIYPVRDTVALAADAVAAAAGSPLADSFAGPMDYGSSTYASLLLGAEGRGPVRSDDTSSESPSSDDGDRRFGSSRRLSKSFRFADNVGGNSSINTSSGRRRKGDASSPLRSPRKRHGDKSSRGGSSRHGEDNRRHVSGSSKRSRK